MTHRRPPINIDEFKNVISTNPGIKRSRCFELFTPLSGENNRADKSMIDKVQRQLVKDGWLFVQTQGRAAKYFTVQYAKEHKLPKTLNLKRSAQCPSNIETPEIQQLVTRYNWINRLMNNGSAL